MIKTIVNEVYFWTIRNRHTGYATVSSLDILTHLHNTYVILEDEYIQSIDTALKGLINGETHFEYFFSQIEDNQEAVAIKIPYITKQILSIAFTLVFKVGLYPLECKEWWSKDATDKTWNTFKVYFYWAFQEVRKEHANSGTQAYTENVEIRGDAVKDT